MRAQVKSIAITTAFLLLASLSSLTAQRPTPAARPRPQPQNLQAGAVYVLTNQADNAVAVFRIEANGSLTPIDSLGELPFGAQGIAAK